HRSKMSTNLRRCYGWNALSIMFMLTVSGAVPPSGVIEKWPPPDAATSSHQPCLPQPHHEKPVSVSAFASRYETKLDQLALALVAPAYMPTSPTNTLRPFVRAQSTTTFTRSRVMVPETT